jgi:hypothetical protein
MKKGTKIKRTLSKDEMCLPLRQRLFALYQRAAAYINGESEDDAENEIISEGAQIYIEYEEYLNGFVKAVILKDLEAVRNVFLTIGKCLTHQNRDFDHEVTFAEYTEMGYEIVEELSGFLGAFFDD